MSTIKLLPCPFCGKQPSSEWYSSGEYDDCGYWGIDCCGAFAHEDDEETAAKLWNTRAPMEMSVELKQLADDANSAADRMIEAADRVLNFPQGIRDNG